MHSLLGCEIYWDFGGNHCFFNAASIFLDVIRITSTSWYEPLICRKFQNMIINDAIKMIAGAFIVISVLLGHFVNEYWFLFTAFVGLNLFQSVFTKWCLLSNLLKLAGMKESKDVCATC